LSGVLMSKKNIKRNKSFLRRKVRASTKDTERDVGSRGSKKLIMSGYKSGVSRRDFARREE